MLNPNNLSSENMNQHGFGGIAGNELNQNQPTDFNLESDQIDFFNTYTSDPNFLQQDNFNIEKIGLDNNNIDKPKQNGSSEHSYDFINNNIENNNGLSDNLPLPIENAPLNEEEKTNKKRKKETSKTEPRKRKNANNPDEESETTEKEKKKIKAPNQRRNIKKVLADEKLNEATLRALNEEKERQERLNSVQPAFNPLHILNPQKFDPQQQHIHTNNLNTNPMGYSDQPKTLRQDIISPEKRVNTSGNSSDQSICIIEDDSPVKMTSYYDNSIKIERQVKDNEITDNEDNDIIEINDDEDEDDCQIISESEHLQSNQSKKQILRGIHMNDALNKPDANGQVLINVNHPVEDADVCLLPYIAKSAKTHQIGGIRFMYDNIVESLSRIQIKNTGFGCILAHAMGLGKTFQVISFIEVFLRCTCADRVLCIVPINTIQNWQAEFNNWLPANGQHRLDEDTTFSYKRPFKVFLINDFAKTLKQRTEIILEWRNKGGVLLIGYEMFRTLIQNNKTEKQMKNQTKIIPYENNRSTINIDENPELAKLNDIQKALLTPCLVVCDEGHRIKNNMANIAKTLQKIVTKRRIVLTGYPLQNNLIEYWCMVDFVRPSYLGTKSEFSNMFERPIMNGQCMDSTREDMKLMRYRAHVLHSLLEGFVQRRGHEVFAGQLTQKQEYIILLKMSPVQKQLYLGFMEAIGAMNANEKSNPLRSFAICCKIWNHPDVLYKYHVEKSVDIDLDLPDIPLKKKSQAKSFQLSTQSPRTDENTGFNPFSSTAYQDNRSRSSFDPDWADKLMETYQPNVLENGAKILLSFELIQQSVLIGDKILLFSQSLLTLNLIEKYLQMLDFSNTNEKWTKHKHYYRLDGSTTGTERERLINTFNKKDNDAWLFLISTRAGCLGINLVGANRVIVLDASWNPCHDAQAVCRVYRYGQKKTSYIYRLVADHTMEKKIYDRQISKQSMSDRVVDEIQAENHFTRTEVEKLIHFVKEDVPSADLSDMQQRFTDQVLINSCMKNSHVITKEPFTHESLLLDKKEYQLTEREKNNAFREYQHDRKYFPTSRPSTYSQFYNQRVNNQNSAQSQSNSCYPSITSSYPLPHINPNINYPALAYGNNLLSNSASNSSMNSNNVQSQSQVNNTLPGIYNRSLSEGGKDLDFNLHSNSTNYNSNGNIYSTPRNNQNFSSPSMPNTSPAHPNRQPTEQLTPTNRAQINAQVSQNLRDVKITRFVVANQIVIQGAVPANETSANNAASSAVIIQPGQQVYLLTSHKGTFLRTPDKKYITFTEEIRNKLFNSIVKNSDNNETPTKNPEFIDQNQYSSVKNGQSQHYEDFQGIKPPDYQPIIQQTNNMSNMPIQNQNSGYQEILPINGNLKNSTLTNNMTSNTNFNYNTNQGNGNDFVLNNYNEFPNMASNN